jgi:hypothetical protein
MPKGSFGSCGCRLQSVFDPIVAALPRSGDTSRPTAHGRPHPTMSPRQISYHRHPAIRNFNEFFGFLF